MCENGHGSPLSKGSSQREYPHPRQIPFEGGVGSESLASPNDKGVLLSPKRHSAAWKGPVLWIGVDKRGYCGVITSRPKGQATPLLGLNSPKGIDRVLGR
jgi:hypothetical protein